jgi:hypothetical protein
MLLSQRVLPLVAAGIVSSVAAGPALADISEQIFIIQASNQNGTATYVVNAGQPDRDGMYSWSLPNTMTLRNNQGAAIATLSNAFVQVHEDPDVTLNFNVIAGNVPTVFSIVSAVVGPFSVDPAQGRASASLTITDLNGDGVTLTPDTTSQGGAYASRYNSPNPAPAGSVFHDFFAAPLSTPFAGDSVSISGDFPGGGAFTPIAGEVTHIASRFSFTLSANDLASGTSIFRVVPVPAPAAATLLGLGGLVGARRRRR